MYVFSMCQYKIIYLHLSFTVKDIFHNHRHGKMNFSDEVFTYIHRLTNVTHLAKDLFWLKEGMHDAWKKILHAIKNNSFLFRLLLSVLKLYYIHVTIAEQFFIQWLLIKYILTHPSIFVLCLIIITLTEVHQS